MDCRAALAMTGFEEVQMHGLPRRAALAMTGFEEVFALQNLSAL